MYQFYCLSYNNPIRHTNMREKFEKLGQPYSLYEGVSINDERIMNNNSSRVWSCMYGHLDMINNFYNSSLTFGIFCEDDILIHKDLIQMLPKILDDYTELELDVLLLGYLLPYKNLPDNSHFQKQHVYNSIYTYNHYPDYLWGAQMYVLSKKNAKKILDKYYIESGYANKTILNAELTPFSADWTITKDGKRSLIYPPLAIENGDVGNGVELSSQDIFHKMCYTTHFDENLFI